MTAVASWTRVRVVVDHTMPLQRSTKISHWYLPHQDFIFCQKHLEQAFFCVAFFTHIHLMRRLSSMGKSHCWTSLWRPVYIAASTESLWKIYIIFMLLESAFHWLFSLKFSSKLVTFFKELCKKTKVGVFSEHRWG